MTAIQQNQSKSESLKSSLNATDRKTDVIICRGKLIYGQLTVIESNMNHFVRIIELSTEVLFTSVR